MADFLARGTDVGSRPAPSVPTRAFRDAAEELVWLLADEAVENLFINPGTDTAPVQEALARARAEGTPSPRSILCLHEQVALSAAIGHFFLSDTPQAVMVHVDAGTLNLGGAIHQAQRNRVPVVIFAGRSPYSTSADVPGHRDRPIHWQQEQPDQAAVMRAYGKWAMEVPRGRELGALVRRAFQVADSEPRGPAYVMLPRETLMEQPGPLTRRLSRPLPTAPDLEGLRKAARMLASARAPVIVTGRTGSNPAAAEALVRLAEHLGAPVIDMRDRVNFPARHPLYAGETPELLRDADAVLLLDVDVPWIPAKGGPPRDAVIVQIDIDCLKVTMPSWSFPVDLAINANTMVALPLLERELSALSGGADDRWRQRRVAMADRLAPLRKRWVSLAQSADPAQAPDAMVARLNDALPPDAVVLEEAVTNRRVVARQVVREYGRYFQAGAPALGWALGGAMGARLARPDAPVVAVCGDGAFNFGVPTAAFFSARKAGAPFLTVILDNGAYRASRNPVAELYPEGVATTRGDFPETELAPAPDYIQLVRAYGGDGDVVERPEEMAGAVRRGLELVAAGRCAVIDAKLPGAISR